VKKAVIGKRMAHAVKKAQITERIHVEFVVVITPVALIVLECHVRMHM
jgi:hypothetical protein